jgi:cell division protein FtsN
VAAYNARQDATSLAARLKQRGYDVRVVGDRAPYRVRIGRYATRADANAALARIRASRLTGIVVEAEPNR